MRKVILSISVTLDGLASPPQPMRRGTDHKHRGESDMDSNRSGSPEEPRVRDLIERWAKAISSGDRPAILAHHSPDLLMFDFPPQVVRGIDAYDRTWDF